MPPFSDPAQLHQAISGQAIPALEAILANNNLRSLRRFERDDPPPYESSTESEELDVATIFPPPRDGKKMPEELQAIMDRPIDDDESNRIAHMIQSIVRPDDRYYKEVKRAQHRFDQQFRGRGPRLMVFRGLNGARRKGVIVRHIVKRHWEKLGIWNLDWGFAGRKVQPNDNFKKWTWRWQPEGAADDDDRMYQDTTELVARALRLRKNLRRGEHAPVIPRSNPGQDTTAAQAESFLISRPWFIFHIEVAEETMRYRRLSNEDQRRYPHSARKQVIKWWKERGDWRDEFDKTNWVTGWKWRHESPSPEPEDLTPIDNIQDSVLEDAADMDFTPSEIDELETIDLPRSEQPKGFWVIEERDMPPFFPGQMQDQLARVEKRQKERAEMLEKARAEGREMPVDPVIEAFRKKFFGGGPIHLFGPPPPVEKNEEASAEPQEDASETSREPGSPPPQKRRRLRLRQRQQSQDEMDAVQDQDEPVPTPRRSARIAAIKRPAEPLPSQAAPNKRPRRGAAPDSQPTARKSRRINTAPAAPSTAPSAARETRRKSTTLVPARAAPKRETEETRPSQRRGRPRKESSPSTHSTSSWCAQCTQATREAEEE